MASDQGPVIQSALLRSELTRLRKERGLTQQQVAKTLEWSASKLIRIEGGVSSITKVDLDALLTNYSVTLESHRRERLQALNRGARERAWWDSYRDDAPPAYLSYVGFEAGAAFIRQFQIGFIPALLQTAEYSEVVTAVGSVDPGKVKSLVQLRVQRREEMDRRQSPPRRYFVLDEGVIRRHVGIKNDRTIMPAQLRAVADRAEQDDLVTVRVLPFEAGAHPGLDPFTLLAFDGELPDALFLDTDRGDFTMTTADDDPQVAKYTKDFEDLIEDTLSAAESIALMRELAEKMS